MRILLVDDAPVMDTFLSDITDEQPSEGMDCCGGIPSAPRSRSWSTSTETWWSRPGRRAPAAGRAQRTQQKATASWGIRRLFPYRWFRRFLRTFDFLQI